MNVYLLSLSKIAFSLHLRYPLLSLSDDMINMQIVFSFAEIGDGYRKIGFFFLNKDISITVPL